MGKYTEMRAVAVGFALLGLIACTTGGEESDSGFGFDAGGGDGEDAGRGGFDAPPTDSRLSPDAACAFEGVVAEVERLPIDIIFVVDNSISMEEEIAQVQSGLNDFAAMITTDDEGEALDYRIIMLSLRGEGMVTLPGPPDAVPGDGGERFQVCIPEPLAGDDECGNGERFFQVEVDIRSQQLLEQFLGTLGQTVGYRAEERIGGDPDDPFADNQRGSAPWRDLLRADATKTLVFVTDDNARMVARYDSGYCANGAVRDCPGGVDSNPADTVEWFETAPAGLIPWSGWRSRPAGILDPTWGGLFDRYTVHALYGWEPAECSDFDTDGVTYTELVSHTGGARAHLCDGSVAWAPFFSEVATAVVETAGIACEIPIPEPPEGEFFQRDRINVWLGEDGTETRVGKVGGAGGCDSTGGGWYYDNEDEPTQVILCSATCDRVQPIVGAERTIEVQFGCETIPF